MNDKANNKDYVLLIRSESIKKEYPLPPGKIGYFKVKNNVNPIRKEGKLKELIDSFIDDKKLINIGYGLTIHNTELYIANIF